MKSNFCIIPDSGPENVDPSKEHVEKPADDTLTTDDSNDTIIQNTSQSLTKSMEGELEAELQVQKGKSTPELEAELASEIVDANNTESNGTECIDTDKTSSNIMQTHVEHNQSNVILPTQVEEEGKHTANPEKVPDSRKSGNVVPQPTGFNTPHILFGGTSGTGSNLGQRTNPPSPFMPITPPGEDAAAKMLGALIATGDVEKSTSFVSAFMELLREVKAPHVYTPQYIKQEPQDSLKRVKTEKRKGYSDEVPSDQVIQIDDSPPAKKAKTNSRTSSPRGEMDVHTSQSTHGSPVNSEQVHSPLQNDTVPIPSPGSAIDTVSPRGSPKGSPKFATRKRKCRPSKEEDD